MNFKKITLALLPLLMLTSCGTTSTAGSDAPSTSTSDTSTVAKTYAITATNGEGYTIDNLSATTATRGETITFKVTVTDTAKIIQSVKYNTTELTANENGVYSFTMPSREVSITVTLRDKPVTYAITASTSDDYSITDLSATNSVAGSEITFKVTVNSSDKSIKSVKANSVSCVKKGELYSFTMPAEAVTIAVELSSSYAITAESGEGYTITDLSEAKAYAGKSISFKVTVTDSMKDIDTVKANGTDCTAIGAGVYSFVMPEAAVTVAVTLKASNLGLDISHMQTGYIINELVPEQSDVFDSTGIKIYTADANGSPVELTTEQYATVEYSSVDIEDLTKPIESTGVKTILVTFGEYSRSFTIAVGTYTVKNVELIAADLEANIKVTCQYTGISELQFKAFNWGMDLQHNNNIDGQGWGTILDTDNEGTSIDFAYGEDNTVGFSLDITKLDNGAYTTHFGHKTVENSNGGQQKMDLLFPKGVNQRITVGDKAYMVQFGAFWGKGDCDITVADKGASYDKVKRVLTNVALTKADNKPVMTIEGTYDAYFNEELTEADIKPAFDMQEINAWTTFTYDSLNPVFTFDAEAKTFKLVIELTQCISEDNIYYFHIAGANLSFEELTRTKVVMDDGKNYTMDKGSAFDNTDWVSGMVAIKYSSLNISEDETDNVTFASMNYILKEGVPYLKVSGSYKYTSGTPKLYVGEASVDAVVTGETFTAEIDVSALEANKNYKIYLSYTVDSEQYIKYISAEDLTDKHPDLASTSSAIYGFRNDNGNYSLKINASDTFEVGSVELKAENEAVNLYVYGAIKAGTSLTGLNFSLKNNTAFGTKALSITENVDANSQVQFVIDVTSMEATPAFESGVDDNVFLLSTTDPEASYEFWPGDWSYGNEVKTASLGGFDYSITNVQQSWGNAQYRLEKKAA